MRSRVIWFSPCGIYPTATSTRIKQVIPIAGIRPPPGSRSGADVSDAPVFCNRHAAAQQAMYTTQNAVPETTASVSNVPETASIQAAAA
jgi:hypothetical protein